MFLTARYTLTVQGVTLMMEPRFIFLSFVMKCFIWVSFWMFSLVTVFYYLPSFSFEWHVLKFSSNQFCSKTPQKLTYPGTIYTMGQSGSMVQPNASFSYFMWWYSILCITMAITEYIKQGPSRGVYDQFCSSLNGVQGCISTYN